MDNMRRIGLIGVFFFCMNIISVPLYAKMPVMKFVYMVNYAPFSFYDENGEVIGMQPEIVQSIADRLGIEVVHELYPWERSQQMVKAGKADAMLTTPTVKRFEYAVFAKEETCPHIWNLFIRKGDERMAKLIPTFKGIEDLKKIKLIDFIGNGWTKVFMKKSDGFTNIHSVADPGVISLMLAKGRGDLVISSSSLMNYHAARHGIREQLAEYDIDWPWTRFHLVIQISRKSPWSQTGVIKAMDEVTRKIKEEGVYLQILKKYKSKIAEGYIFKSQLNDNYLTKHGFYADYDKMPKFSLPSVP
ncbi:MAG: amino acid ABC transporter substrate-binding protein [Desulfobacteraceae bacterium]|nr:amino acid ABC transporter substrate-binding protein [Desulfobacteraceae bacterium]